MVFHKRGCNKTILLSKLTILIITPWLTVENCLFPPISFPSPNSGGLVGSHHWSHCFLHLSHVLLFYLNMESGIHIEIKHLVSYG